MPDESEVVVTAVGSVMVTEYDPATPLTEAGWVQAIFPLKHSFWKEHKAWNKLINSEQLIDRVTLKPWTSGSTGKPWKPTTKPWRAWHLKKASRHSNRNGPDWESWTAECGPVLLEADPSKDLLKMALVFAEERTREAMQRRAESARYRLDPQDKSPVIESQAVKAPPPTGAQIIGEPLPH